MRKIFASLLIMLGFSVSHAQDLMSILDGKDSLTASPVESQILTELRSQIDQVSPEQNIFLGFFSKGELDKALFQWRSAFAGTTFASRPVGQALHAYLLWKNGLPLLALEELFAISDPSGIPIGLRKLWTEEALPEHPAWKWAHITWRKEWLPIFGVAIEVRVRSQRLGEVNDLTNIEELLRKTTPDSEERAMVAWQMVVGLALADEAAKSAKILNILLQSKQVPVEPALMNITAARLLYQNGYLDAALDYYKRVSKVSEYWFVAQEEMAWTYMRKGEPQNSLATLEGLMDASFKVQMGPEGMLLRALAHLKVCDYSELAKDLIDFRNRFQDRSKTLLQLVEGQQNLVMERLIGQLEKGRISLVQLGHDGQLVPRFVSRDEELFRRVAIQEAFAAEKKQAEELYARSLSGSSAEVGYQGPIEELKVAAMKRWNSARTEAFERIKFLANEELSEIKLSLQKMHIIEAELIQQIQMSTQRGLANAKKVDVKIGTTGSHSGDLLRFPFKGEVWFDEIGNYRVDIKKGCQARLGGH